MRKKFTNLLSLAICALLMATCFMPMSAMAAASHSYEEFAVGDKIIVGADGDVFATYNGKVIEKTREPIELTKKGSVHIDILQVVQNRSENLPAEDQISIDGNIKKRTETEKLTIKKGKSVKIKNPQTTHGTCFISGVSDTDTASFKAPVKSIKYDKKMLKAKVKKSGKTIKSVKLTGKKKGKTTVTMKDKWGNKLKYKVTIK